MKRILSLLLALTLVIMIGSVSFAAGDGTKITDPEVPGAPVENVNAATYVEPDEAIPTAPVNESVTDEVVPKGDALPKTGGIPAEAFYAAGALFVVAALIISKKK